MYYINPIVILSEQQVATRLRSLRTAYSRMKKLAPSGSGTVKLTARKAHIFKRLSFLRVHTTSRGTKSTLGILSTTEVMIYVHPKCLSQL